MAGVSCCKYPVRFSLIREWDIVKVNNEMKISRRCSRASMKMTSFQDSLIEFLKMAHVGLKGAAFLLPDGSPAAAAADIGNMN